MKEPIKSDITKGQLFVDHLGYTLRVLLSAAAEASPERRKWDIVYKHVTIGSVKISNLKKDI